MREKAYNIRVVVSTICFWLVFGVIFIAIAAIVLFENINTNMKYLSILFLVIGLLSLLGNKGKKQTNLLEKDEFINQNDALSEEIENINKQRNQICAQLYLKPENNIYTILNEIKLKTPYWNLSANLLNEMLPLLLNNLIKIKTIHEDSTIGPSQKALAISQLFALFNNAVTNTKILNEKQKQSKIMEYQLEEMKKNNRGMQAQNDLLTLQTYNKVSEMQCLYPTLVAAQTYSQMAKIRKERNKED